MELKSEFLMLKLDLYVKTEKARGLMYMLTIRVSEVTSGHRDPYGLMVL